MARKVSERERVLRYFMEASRDELQSVMDQLRVILDVRFPTGKPKRGRKAKAVELKEPAA